MVLSLGKTLSAWCPLKDNTYLNHIFLKNKKAPSGLSELFLVEVTLCHY